MKIVNYWSLTILAAAALLPPTITFAQGQDSFGPPPPGAEERPVTVAGTPLDTLTAALSLTSSQQAQINAIQQSTREEVRDLMPLHQGAQGDQAGPGPGAGPGDDQAEPGPGAGPAPDGAGPMQAAGSQQEGPRPGGFGGDRFSRPTPPDAATIAKIDSAETNASTQIQALLTADQVKSLSTLMDQLKDLQTVGIPPRLYTRLQLPSDEMNKIHAVAAASNDEVKSALQTAVASGDYGSVQEAMQASRQKAHEEAMALLTSTQSALVRSELPHRRGERGFGGPPQGFGGPGDDFAGAPPQGGPQSSAEPPADRSNMGY